MSAFYPFRGGGGPQKGHFPLFLPFFLHDGFPKKGGRMPPSLKFVFCGSKQPQKYPFLHFPKCHGGPGFRGQFPLLFNSRGLFCVFFVYFEITLSLEFFHLWGVLVSDKMSLGCRDYVNWCLFGGMSGGGTRTAQISTGFKLGKKFRDIIHISCNSIQSEIN